MNETISKELVQSLITNHVKWTEWDLNFAFKMMNEYELKNDTIRFEKYKALYKAHQNTLNSFKRLLLIFN